MMTATQRHAALSEFLGPQFKIYTNTDGTPHSLQSIFQHGTYLLFNNFVCLFVACCGEEIMMICIDRDN
jgi:hypothetical protein